MKKKSLLKNPIIILTMLMTFLNLIIGNVPMSILFTVLFLGNVIVHKLDEIEYEKNKIRKEEDNKRLDKKDLKQDKTKEYSKEISNTKKNEEEIVDNILLNVILLEKKYNISFEKDISNIKKIIDIILNKIIEENNNLKTKNEIINKVTTIIENIFNNATIDDIKVINENYVKNILKIKNNREYYYEKTIKKEKNVYDW